MVALSAWLLVAPAVGGASADGHLLPACCRNLGAHHCAGTTAAFSRSHGATLRSAACPLLPQRSFALLERSLGARPLGLTFSPSTYAFFSRTALHGHAKRRALESPRAPPAS
ncbi:MAG TPA: hypothetical protein VGD62_04725 [Acidobacteriaceae bacterium]